jgi:hypothetical protein
MRVARERSSALAAIASICVLQGRACEARALRAAAAHRAARERHEACGERLAQTQAGWSEALARATFDPGLAGHWFAAIELASAEERRLAAQEQEAREALERDRAAWQAAMARSDAAQAQAKAAARRADRQRDEGRLAAIEERATLGAMR